MGVLFSRFRKAKTTVEVLEDIDKEILSLEKFKRSCEESRTWLTSRVIFWTIIIYPICLIGVYFVHTPDELLFQALKIVPVVLIPLMSYFFKRIVQWWFVRKIRKNELQLKDLREKRKDILENVMETETYKRAKEILEKFDPETKKKLEEEKRMLERGPLMQSPHHPGQELRRRNVIGQQQQSGDTTGTPMKQANQQQQQMMMTPMHNQSFPPTPGGPSNSHRKPLPRPLLRQNPSAMDKVIEYFVGDGLNNRYALICANCYSHNGMALKEEFEYLSFICAYCRFFNKARKQRPGAPPLSLYGTPLPQRQQQQQQRLQQQQQNKPNDPSQQQQKALPAVVEAASVKENEKESALTDDGDRKSVV